MEVDDEGYGQGEVGQYEAPKHTDYIEEGFELEEEGEVIGNGWLTVEEYFEGI